MFKKILFIGWNIIIAFSLTLNTLWISNLIDNTMALDKAVLAMHCKIMGKN